MTRGKLMWGTIVLALASAGVVWAQPHDWRHDSRARGNWAGGRGHNHVRRNNGQWGMFGNRGDNDGDEGYGRGGRNRVYRGGRNGVYRGGPWGMNGNDGDADDGGYGGWNRGRGRGRWGMWGNRNDGDADDGGYGRGGVWGGGPYGVYGGGPSYGGPVYGGVPNGVYRGGRRGMYGNRGDNDGDEVHGGRSNGGRGNWGRNHREYDSRGRLVN